MSKVFYRKKFSDYLGEQRAIDDIVTFYEPDPIPPTPSPTPGNVTPTPTPTLTETPTPTPSVTSTLTPTPTNTGTPTPTPTRTPAPACDVTYVELATPTPTPTNTGTPTPTPTLTQTPTPSGGPSFDPDAQTYMNAVIAGGGTLSSPQQTAVNNFFVGLKSDGIYNKFYYLHLFLGGTAVSNAINAVSPGTYNLSFQGTWTHSTSGSTTTQNNANYAESGFVVSLASPSTTQTDFSFGLMLNNRNLPITSYQYQGIGTSASNYMIIGFDWIQPAFPGGIDNWWSNNRKEPIAANTKTGGWSSLSRNGTTSWYSAVLMNGETISTGLTKSSIYTDVFTPSSTPYDINLFRVNGLNNYSIGGNALLNYASTYLSPTDIDSFAQRANTLQVAFSRQIFI